MRLRPTTSSSWSRRPSRRPTRPRRSCSSSRRGVRSRSTASASRWSSCSSGLGAAGSTHGVGIVDHIEDRIVGLKVRDLYEVPAATIVLTAHRELEKLVSTIHQNNFKGGLESHWAYLCYAGLWHEPLRADLDAYMRDGEPRSSPARSRVKLYKGSATVVGRSSPYALYDKSLAGFSESGGEFSQNASPGFIELFSLQSRMAHRVRDGD